MTEEKNNVRRYISEAVLWALHFEDQEELNELIHGHYEKRDRLSFDERALICDAWKKIEIDEDKKQNK